MPSSRRAIQQLSEQVQTQPQPPAFMSDPVGAVTDIVLAVEPGLDPALVALRVRDVTKDKGAQRRLAKALSSDPDLLTSARPEGPRSVGRLIRALLAIGASTFVVPCCATCGLPRPLERRDGDQRICTPCATLSDNALPCSICGKTGVLVPYRDSQGHRRCGTCGPGDDDEDPQAAIVALLHRLEPALPAENVIAAIREAVRHPPQLRRVAAELTAAPDLLTGRGARGTPRANALINALAAHGSVKVVVPACPGCGKVKKLYGPVEKIRHCSVCYRHAHARPCAGCGRTRPAMALNVEGLPLCHTCAPRQAHELDTCAGCARHGPIASRAAGQSLCRTCAVPVTVCESCGKTRRCRRSKNGSLRCEYCRHGPRKAETCSRCGNTRTVAARTASGQALCDGCGLAPQPCSACGKTRRVNTRTPTGQPLCRSCWGKNPLSFQDCTRCDNHEPLWRNGLCCSCTRDDIISEVLTGPDGTVRPDLHPVAAALKQGDPLTLVRRLEPKTFSRRMLQRLATSTGPLTHETLDELGPRKAVTSLRDLLVANGALTERDERLAALEKWLPSAGDSLTPGEQQILHRYLNWQHLRRLRRASGRKRVTEQQMHHVRAESNQVTALFHWLRERGTTLATCNQGHIDAWLTESNRSHRAARGFVGWARNNSHAATIRIPTRDRARTIQYLDEDERWNILRRLLHDENLPLQDRVAGILVVLFGQKLIQISDLRSAQITGTPGNATILLGEGPIALPPAVDELFLHLRDQPEQHPGTEPTNKTWLFPGRRPHAPACATTIAIRLNAIGITPRQARNTTLRDRAGRMPAVLLSELLGLHIQTATQWRHRAQGGGTAYAADIARR